MHVRKTNTSTCICIKIVVSTNVTKACFIYGQTNTKVKLQVSASVYEDRRPYNNKCYNNKTKQKKSKSSR